MLALTSVATAAFFAAPALCLSQARAASDELPLPAVLTHPLQPQQLVQMTVVAPLDVDALLKDDVARSERDLPPRYAIPHPAKITPDDSGTWEPLDDFNSVWRMRVRSQGAISLNFGFTRYHMPEGGRLHVYSADLRMVIRAFTDADNAAHGELWTPPVVGEEAVIEVVVPNESRNRLGLTLGSINVGYREFAIPSNLKRAPAAGDEGGIASGSCNIDVVCPQGDDWRDEIATVGVISTGGSTFCTGFMVNNTAQDRTPYFMTADHCPLGPADAASLVVFWNYENSTCRPIGSPASGGPGDGSTSDFQTGSFFRASYALSDMTLVELDESPDPSWGVTYAGWDRSGANPPFGACVHHPHTDEKRISFWGGPLAFHPSHGSSWGCSPYPGPGDNSHIKVYWTPGLGVTEVGSSGSPLFDHNRRVIGQLHGGTSACGQVNDGLSDCYGRFSLSFTGGGTPSTRLSDWLDPSSTGLMFIDTIGYGLIISPAGTVTHFGAAGGPFSPSSTQYAISNATEYAANFNVSIVGGGTAPITLNGGTNPLQGVVPAYGAAQFTVAPAPGCTSLVPGVYTTNVLIEDVTNGINYTQPHIVEVGQVGYTTTPTNDLIAGGPVGGPFSASQTYVLTSTRPTPVTVAVAASASWISINGVPGPVNILLPALGSTANVTIGYSAAANSLSEAIYNGSVTFNATSGGSVSNTTRNVSLDVGRYTYVAADVPLSILDDREITSLITVADNYCVGDLNLPIDVTHTYVGDLRIEITSPAGTVVRLHSNSGGGSADILTTYDDEPGGTLPDGPGTLSQFDGENVQGVWKLTVSDNAFNDNGSLNAWSLKIAAQPECLQYAVVYDFPMNIDPGWTTMGQWAFGVPAGAPSPGHYPDPSAGATGANVYGYNLNGPYPNNLAPPQYLTTPPLNLTGKTGTQLRFKRWIGIESGTWDHANIQISTNGTTWSNVWTHVGAALDDGMWKPQTYDISAVADNKPAVRLRWGMGTTDSTTTYCGWNIDDVQILALAPACMGDVNADSGVNVNDLLAVITSWGACANCPAARCAADVSPPNGDCQVNVNDLLAVIVNWGGCP